MSNDAAHNIDPREDSVSSRSDETTTGPDRDADQTAERPATRPRQSPMVGCLGSSAADLLGPQLVLATQDQGYTAALNGDHLDTCPWRSAETDRERALRQMWIRGYSAGRTDLRSARDPDRPSP
jgi:ribosome modulation factor